MTDWVRVIENPLVIVVCLLAMFVLSGIEKVYSFTSAAESLRGKLQPYNLNLSQNFYSMFIGIVILIEIVCPLIVFYYFYKGEYKEYAYYSLIALIVFTILATILYHPPDFTSYKRSIPALANLSLIGGMMLLSKQLK